jgi:hypothetical protein
LNPWNFDAFLNLNIVEEGGSTSLEGKYPITKMKLSKDTSETRAS